jgi:hypothetical protein
MTPSVILSFIRSYKITNPPQLQALQPPKNYQKFDF